MLKDLKIIDPREILQEECPIFIQSANMKGLFGLGIRTRTKSNFNHSMIMIRPEFIASQALMYKEIPIEKYMKRGSILKFWVCEDITATELALVVGRIQKDLKKPWYKRFYDFPGVVGQFFGLRWFNVPWLNYCSERVAGKIRVIIPDLRKKPTPEDIEQAFKDSPRMKILGYWFDT